MSSDRSSLEVNFLEFLPFLDADALECLELACGTARLESLIKTYFKELLLLSINNIYDCMNISCSRIDSSPVTARIILMKPNAIVEQVFSVEMMKFKGHYSQKAHGFHGKFDRTLEPPETSLRLLSAINKKHDRE